MVPYTVKARVGVVDGKIEAFWGLSFRHGLVVAFCDLNDGARKYPVLMHKTAKALLRQARDDGHRYVWAEIDPQEPLAQKWLARLGFIPAREDGTVMIWQA